MRPFFCISAPRAGSTLLTRMLNAHSKIAAPFEVPIAKYSFGADNESLILDKIAQISKLVGADIRRAIDEPSYLFEEILRYEKKDALVVKEPSNSLHLMRLRYELGDVPLIHIVRDVRQVMQSKAFESSGITPVEAGQLWHKHNYQALRYMQQFSASISIRYEDLVAKPVLILERLLDWMGYAYEEGIEEYWNFEHSDRKLKLWDGTAPGKSTWAKDIEAKKLLPVRQVVPKEIQALYESSEAVVKLNRFFGYT